MLKVRWDRLPIMLMLLIMPMAVGILFGTKVVLALYGITYGTCIGLKFPIFEARKNG